MTYDADQPGAFDDLLDPPANKRRASTRLELEVAVLVAKALEGLAEGAPRVPRPRTCCRCEAQADLARKRGELVIPPEDVERWQHQGRVYFAATCTGCTDVEWSALWQRKYDLAEERSNSTEMRRLTDIAMRRQERGRRILIRTAGPQRATYGAR